MKCEVANVPPVIRERSRVSAPLIAMLLAAGAIAAAQLSQALGIPLFKCGFLATTGLPCPFCGGTRSLRALATWDFAGAFLWNPLVAIGVAVAFGWGIFWAAGFWSEKAAAWLERLAPRVLVAAVALNWAYLIYRFGWAR